MMTLTEFCNQTEAPAAVGVDLEKLEYGLYGDHTKTRPYSTLDEGVLWYAAQPAIQGLPESLIAPMVAHNLGISFPFPTGGDGIPEEKAVVSIEGDGVKSVLEEIVEEK